MVFGGVSSAKPHSPTNQKEVSHTNTELFIWWPMVSWEGIVPVIGYLNLNPLYICKCISWSFHSGGLPYDISIDFYCEFSFPTMSLLLLPPAHIIYLFLFSHLWLVSFESFIICLCKFSAHRRQDASKGLWGDFKGGQWKATGIKGQRRIKYTHLIKEII